MFLLDVHIKATDIYLYDIVIEVSHTWRSKDTYFDLNDKARYGILETYKDVEKFGELSAAFIFLSRRRKVCQEAAKKRKRREGFIVCEYLLAVAP